MLTPSSRCTFIQSIFLNRSFQRHISEAVLRKVGDRCSRSQTHVAPHLHVNRVRNWMEELISQKLILLKRETGKFRTLGEKLEVTVETC